MAAAQARAAAAVVTRRHLPESFPESPRSHQSSSQSLADGPWTGPDGDFRCTQALVVLSSSQGSSVKSSEDSRDTPLRDLIDDRPSWRRDELPRSMNRLGVFPDATSAAGAEAAFVPVPSTQTRARLEESSAALRIVGTQALDIPTPPHRKSKGMKKPDDLPVRHFQPTQALELPAPPHSRNARGVSNTAAAAALTGSSSLAYFVVAPEPTQVMEIPAPPLPHRRTNAPLAKSPNDTSPLKRSEAEAPPTEDLLDLFLHGDENSASSSIDLLDAGDNQDPVHPIQFHTSDIVVVVVKDTQQHSRDDLESVASPPSTQNAPDSQPDHSLNVVDAPTTAFASVLAIEPKRLVVSTSQATPQRPRIATTGVSLLHSSQSPADSGASGSNLWRDDGELRRPGRAPATTISTTTRTTTTTTTTNIQKRRGASEKTTNLAPTSKASGKQWINTKKPVVLKQAKMLHYLVPEHSIVKRSREDGGDNDANFRPSIGADDFFARGGRFL